MASSFVRVIPLIRTASLETSEEQLVPARVIGAFVHEKRGEHRAGTAPRNPARIADHRFEMAIELLRNIFRRRQFELQ